MDRVDRGIGVHTRVGEQGQDVLEIGAHVGLAGCPSGIMLASAPTDPLDLKFRAEPKP